jgi:hypothetical protein
MCSSSTVDKHKAADRRRLRRADPGREGNESCALDGGLGQNAVTRSKAAGPEIILHRRQASVSLGLR